MLEVIPVSLRTQMDFGGIIKIIQIMSVMIVQTKCKLNNAEFFLTLFLFRAKKSETKTTTKKTKRSRKWQSEISPEYQC